MGKLGVVSFLIICIFSSCFAFKLKRRPKVESHALISKDLSGKLDHYVILYRSANYLQKTHDSTSFDITNFRVFNQSGKELILYDNSKYDVCSDEMRYQVITRFKPDLNTFPENNAFSIDSLFNVLETAEGKNRKKRCWMFINMPC